MKNVMILIVYFFQNSNEDDHLAVLKPFPLVL